MGTYGQALTATDYAAGLRALADALEEYGLPASSRHPEQPLTTNFFVESVAAVKDFAATHDLPVNVSGNHTSATIALGPNPNTSYPGSVELSVVHIDKSDETESVEEPEQATGVDTYDCPEPGCDFNVSAAGPQDPDDYHEFNDEIDVHERGHAEDNVPDGDSSTPDYYDVQAAHRRTRELSDLWKAEDAAAEDGPSSSAAKRARLLAVAEECELGDNAEMARICRSAAYDIPAAVDEPVGALTAPPGVVLVPPPALVQLDQDDAGHRVVAAALAFDELDDRREGLDVAGVDAWDTAREGLRQALADFREVNR